MVCYSLYSRNVPTELLTRIRLLVTLAVNYAQISPSPGAGCSKQRGIFICNHKEHVTIATAPEIMPLLNFLIKLDYLLKF